MHSSFSFPKYFQSNLGPLFTVTVCLLVYDHEKWSEIRFKLLEQMILMSHVREFSLNPKSSFNEVEREPMPYAKDRNIKHQCIRR